MEIGPWNGRAKIGTFLPSFQGQALSVFGSREGVLRGRTHFAKQLVPPPEPISLVTFLFGNKKVTPSNMVRDEK